jgi:hypothetical protein
MSIWEAVGVASAPATSRRDGFVGSYGLAPLVMIARLKAICDGAQPRSVPPLQRPVEEEGMKVALVVERLAAVRTWEVGLASRPLRRR